MKKILPISIILIAIVLGSITDSLAWDISGTIRDFDGEEPLEMSVLIEVVQSASDVISSITVEDGMYEFIDLDWQDGVYYTVRATAIEEDGWRCPTYLGDTWIGVLAQSVYPAEEDVLEDMDINILSGGRISGSVIKESGGNFESGEIEVHVWIWYWGVESAEVFVVDDPANYSINLPASDENNGHYGVGFFPRIDGYLPQFYDRTFIPWQAEQVELADEQHVEGIDGVLERGVKLFGTIQDPDGNVPEPGDLGIEIDRADVDIFGQQENVFISDWDEEGNWEAIVPRGIYAFYIQNWSEDNWVNSYSNGALTAWEAEWHYCATEACGPFDITLMQGGIISGTVFNPDGDAASDVSIDVYQGNSHVYGEWPDYETGEFTVRGVKPGEYFIQYTPEVEDWEDEEPRDGLNLERLWPTMYTGNTTNFEDHTTFQVEAGEETEADIQLMSGGGLEVTVLDENGEQFGMESGVWGFTWSIDSDDRVDYNAASFEDEESSVSGFALMPGEYRVGFMPVYLAGIVNEETPSMMRTTVGGTFGLEGATAIEVVEGEVATEEIRVMTGGHTVSGVVVNEEGMEMPNQVFIVDADVYLAAGSFSYFMGPEDRNGEFMIKGIPDGDYYVIFGTGDEGIYPTIWYPDVMTDGLDGGIVEVPEGAEMITIDGADVSGLELTLIRSDNFQSVDREPKSAVSPVDFKLYSAYPNPFNDKSHIVFNLKTAAEIEIGLFDVAGRKVADIAKGNFNAGMHHAGIDAAGLATGAYIVRMQAGGVTQTQKVMLLK